MTTARGRYRGTDERRREIIDAALACFTEAGFLTTTMDDIRRRSGASTGSVYHHFKSKEQLAAEVYLAGVSEYQAGLTALLATCRRARQGIVAIVEFHLRWARDHADRARYLARMRHAEFMVGAESAVAQANGEFVGALGAFFRRHVADGSLRRLPPELYLSLILGPSQELVRHWLLAGRPIDFDQAVDELAECAWRAVSTGGATTPPRSRRMSRIRVRETKSPPKGGGGGGWRSETSKG